MRNYMSFMMSLFTSLVITSCSPEFGKEKNFNGVQLYYTSSITETQADKLGNYLISSEFADGQEKTVQISKTGKTYEFRMVIKEGIQNDEEYIKVFKELANIISKNVFDGEQVDIHLCNDKLQTIRVVLQGVDNTNESDNSEVTNNNESNEGNEAVLPSDILADDDLVGKTLIVKGVYVQVGESGVIYDQAGSMSGIMVDISKMSKDEKKEIIKNCSQGCEISLKAKVFKEYNTKKLSAIEIN